MMSTLEKKLLALLVVAWAAAQLAWFFQAVDVNPQYDKQVIAYGLDMLNAYLSGTLSSFFFALRKYPLWYVTQHFLAFNWLLPDKGTMTIVHMVSRALSLAHVTGNLVLTYFVSRRLHGHGGFALTLACSSLLLFQFATATRPHGVIPFYVLLTLCLSLSLLRVPKAWKHVAAFASGVLAAITLQNGFTAFVFPVWARLRVTGLNLRSLATAWLWLLGSGAVALGVGYAYLWTGVEANLPIQNSISLGHGYDVTPVPWLFVQNLWHIAAGETLIACFFLLALWRMYGTRTLSAPVGTGAILLFMAVNYAVFSMISSSDARTFILLYPLMAIVGAPALAQSHRFVRAGTLIVCILLCLRLAYLGLVPGTFERVTAYLQPRTERILIPAGPHFYGVPAVAPGQTADYLVQPDYAVLPDEQWHPCAQAKASRLTNNLVLFWTNTPWGLLELLTAHSSGVNTTVYCREPVASVQQL